MKLTSVKLNETVTLYRVRIVGIVVTSATNEHDVLSLTRESGKLIRDFPLGIS